MADSDPLLFVSHVSEDRVAAMEIVAELEQRGIPCWIAPRDVTPGRPFDDEIVEAIEGSRAILLIFSDLCNESEYIRREVTVAGESRKLIIPFRIEDAHPRRGLRVRLSDLHWLDGFAARERAIDEVARRFAPAAADSPPAPPPAARARAAATSRLPAAAPAASGGRGPVFAVVGVLAAAAIGAGIWFGTGSFTAKPPPPPPAVAPPDALANGKAAFDRKDYAEAIRWLRPAAEQGNPTAQTYVGYLYERGLGAPQDLAEALRWYRKAADQKHAPAQRNLGNLYEQGAGVPQSYGEAMKWFRLAADQGNPGAQTNLGYLFEKGLGVPQSYAEALRWYRRAADQGDTTAQSNIGVFYDKGHGVPQDWGEARRWYSMAAEQGSVDAQYNLALLYAEGRGVPSNMAQARQWMRKAAEGGDPEARKWLEGHGG